MRTAVIEDAGLLAALHAAAFAKPWSETELAELLKNPAAFALVVDGGFVLAWAIADEAEILTLAVRPEARRRGVGAALVEAAATLAHARGARMLHLEVAADNHAARGLYGKLGFAQQGVRPGYYDRGAVDALVLRRDLPL